MHENPISIVVFLCGVILAVIASYAWQHRTTPGSQLFFYFAVSIAVYVIGYSFELASLDVPTMLFWSKIEYLGIYTFPTLFFLFVLQYTGREKYLTWRNILLLFFVPTLLLIGKFSDDRFHLVYSQTWVDTSGMIPMLGFTRGPIYFFALYACVPVSLGILLLWRTRQTTQLLYRIQATLLAASILPPLLVFLIYMSGIQPIPNLKYLDLNAFMYSLWGIGVGWAVFRYRLFDIAPVARDTLIENLSDGVFALDHQMRLVDANPAAARIMGWTSPIIGQPACQAFSTCPELLNICMATEPLAVVPERKIEIQHAIAGQTVFFDVIVTALTKRNKTVGRLVLIHDITDRKLLEQKLLDLSLVDDLTGLSNRRGFYVLASQLIQMARWMRLSATIIFADMDGLKTVNDTFGHAEGDQALVDAANIFRRAIRSSDILARLGGDEFVILTIQTNDNTNESMLDRLQSQLEEFNRQGQRKYRISASFGVVHFDPKQESSFETVVMAADKAMYEQKQAKRKSLL
jgi:diguanylate cyclase (GGDEF)-like protein/PAS domain S-box-containing protein